MLRIGRRVLLRPEFASIVGLVVVFVYFALSAGDAGFLSATGTQNYLEVASEVGIIAVAVTLLLIAKEFDLSVGAVMGAAGVLVAYLITASGWPFLLAAGVGLALGVVVGSINWYFVVRRGLPSFIVTLAMMFALRGLVLAVTRIVTAGTTISGPVDKVAGDPIASIFQGSVLGMPAEFIWLIVITLLAAWLLDRTRFGNWIYATGGNEPAARQAGIPVARVKYILFVTVSCASCLVAILAMMQVNSADVNGGQLKEFQAATAAVIGGAAISGGYGSPIGTFFGALLFGMVNQGFFFTNIPDDWFQTFIGVALLAAVVINDITRRRALAGKRGSKVSA